MKRAAFYMRVSTKGHGQTTETQALALREYAGRRDFAVVEEYRDEGISGSTGSRGVSATCYGLSKNSVTWASISFRCRKASTRQRRWAR